MDERSATGASARVGRNVRAMREHQRLTAAQVAEAVRGMDVNLSRSALSQIELGNRGVSVEELVALSEVLRCPPRDLLFGDRTQDPDPAGVAEMVARSRLGLQSTDVIVRADGVSLSDEALDQIAQEVAVRLQRLGERMPGEQSDDRGADRG